jgi:hypothetical protein
MMVLAATACTKAAPLPPQNAEEPAAAATEAKPAEEGTKLPASITYVTLGSTALTTEEAAELFEQEPA